MVEDGDEQTAVVFCVEVYSANEIVPHATHGDVRAEWLRRRQ